jgi:iron-sulfur cluster repair protein YtfE (RIC family)
MAERNETLRDIGLFAVGTVAGLLLGRFGTPLAARTAGMARSMGGGEDVFEELAADHKRVLAALDQAERAEGKARLPLFLLIKRDLSKHALAEEDVVYPLIADKLHAADAAKHLYEEHGEVKRLLADIEESLELDDELRYRDCVRMLRDNVRMHAQQEETEWFPQLRQALDEKKRAMVTGKVDREKAMLA